MALMWRTVSRMSPALSVVAVMLLWTPCLRAEALTVKAGDEANVHFTCRLKNGDIAASSYPSVAVDPKLHKSPIFVARTTGAPLLLVAGQPPSGPNQDQARGFEGEIIYQLSKAVVGLRVGEKQTREMAGERLQEKKKDDYHLQMARVRQRVKEMRLTPEQYKAQTGRAAEVGRPFVIDPAVPGEVSSVTESEVVIRFSAEAGEKVATPFGEGTVNELPDRYEIVIDARQGALVRSGGYVGRITAVDDKTITIDYSHPFGEESLLCDVLVESTAPRNK
jgi:FKBP-type peptidyl-prolyl cis-trans isomerase 2